MFALMAVQPGRTHGIDVGALLDQTLRELGMSHKEAWVIAGFTDAAAFSRAIHGEAYAALDLWKLAELPWKVQAMFWSKYIAAQATRFTGEMRSERLQMARADLPAHSERKAG